MDRREFIRYLISLGFSATAAAALSALSACQSKDAPPQLPQGSPGSSPLERSASPPSPQGTPIRTPSSTYLSVARGSSPAAITEAAIKALGGIELFVKPGQEVIIKPNICVAYHSYEYAATTNPEVVATLVKLCLGAGARRVKVFDQPFGGTAQEAFVRSGIGEAVKAAGGLMEIMSNMKFREVAIPQGKDITRWAVYGDVLDADVFINVPIAKHHNLARLTLGMKNLMGVIKDRGNFHANLGQRVADLYSLIRPTLTVVDAVRILMNHGPTGGNLEDVKLTNTVIASPDTVAADAYGTTLFGLNGADIPSIRAGAQMGLGTLDLKAIKISDVNV